MRHLAARSSPVLQEALTLLPEACESRLRRLFTPLRWMWARPFSSSCLQTTVVSANLHARHSGFCRVPLRAARCRRQRKLLPLPIPQRCLQAWGRALDDSRPWSRKKRGDRHAGDLANYGTDLWLGLQILSVNFLEGGCTKHRVAPVCRLSPFQAQRDAIARLRARATYFVAGLGPGGQVVQTPTEAWPLRLKGRTIDYCGNVVSSPLPLVAAQLEHGLPPEVFGATIDLVAELGDSDLAWSIQSPDNSLRPEAKRPASLTQARGQVEDDPKWADLDRRMSARKVARIVLDEEVPRHRGRRVLCGAFAVRKAGSVLANGDPICRIIMDVRACNELLQCFGGDLGDMALPSQCLSLVLAEDEVMLVSGEDLKSSFYICRLPHRWAAYFCFERELPGFEVGSPERLVRIGASVLPMGFSNATACLQTWHWRLALNVAERGSLAVPGLPGLRPEEERRRGAPHPWTQPQRPRALWHLYLDDFTEHVVVSRQHAHRFQGQPRLRQRELRRLYAARRVPRSEDKAIEGVPLAERLGYFLDGAEHSVGVTRQRALETAGLDIELLCEDRMPVLPLQILAGRLGHALQANRAL